jgi:hypothetical protein
VSEGPSAGELRARVEATLSERGRVAAGESPRDPRTVSDAPRSESVVWRGVYPGMCADPELCRGRGSCPRNISCCE